MSHCCKLSKSRILPWRWMVVHQKSRRRVRKPLQMIKIGSSTSHRTCWPQSIRWQCAPKRRKDKASRNVSSSRKAMSPPQTMHRGMLVHWTTQTCYYPWWKKNRTSQESLVSITVQGRSARSHSAWEGFRLPNYNTISRHHSCPRPLRTLSIIVKVNPLVPWVASPPARHHSKQILRLSLSDPCSSLEAPSISNLKGKAARSRFSTEREVPLAPPSQSTLNSSSPHPTML